MPRWNLQLKLRCVSLISPFLDWNALILSYLTVVGHSQSSSMKVGGGEGMLSALPQWFVSLGRISEGREFVGYVFLEFWRNWDLSVMFWCSTMLSLINATRCL
jgi:hypothetical protein